MGCHLSCLLNSAKIRFRCIAIETLTAALSQTIQARYHLITSAGPNIR
jgi:hypothetical protein